MDCAGNVVGRMLLSLPICAVRCSCRALAGGRFQVWKTSGTFESCGHCCSGPSLNRDLSPRSRSEGQIESYSGVAAGADDNFLCHLVWIFVFISLKALDVTFPDYAFMPHFDAIGPRWNIRYKKFAIHIRQSSIRI